MNKQMDRWDNSKPTSEQAFLGEVTIIVETEHARQQLLLALEYIHDVSLNKHAKIDTDYMAVNSLLHGYQDYKILVNGVEE